MLPRKERRRLERRLNKAKRRGKMKKFKYEPDFERADGQPFSIPDPDVKVQKGALDKAREEEKAKAALQGRAPEIVTYDVPRMDCDFAQAMCWFVNNIPHGLERDKDGKLVLDREGNPQRSTRKLTPEDTGNAYAVIKAFKDVQNGYVELESSVYIWLVELNKTDGVEAFRITQAEVARRLEDTVKEGKETKSGE